MHKCSKLLNPLNCNCKKKTGSDGNVNSKKNQNDLKKGLSEKGDHNDDDDKVSVDGSQEKIFKSDEAINKIKDDKIDSSQSQSIGKKIGHFLSCLNSKRKGPPLNSCKCGCNIRDTNSNSDENNGNKKDCVCKSSKPSDGGCCMKKKLKSSLKNHKEIGVKMELLYSLKCPKCGVRHECNCRRKLSCACYPTVIPEKPRPRKKKDTKIISETKDTINPSNPSDPGLGYEDYHIDDDGGEIVKEVNEQLDDIVDKILKLDTDLKQLEKTFLRTKDTAEAKVNITKQVERKRCEKERSRMLLRDDKYSIIRSPSNPSILCIQPPKNVKYNLCNKNFESRDCIRISPKENIFSVHGSYLRDDESMVDVVELVRDFITTKVNELINFDQEPDYPDDCCAECQDNNQNNTDANGKEEIDILQSKNSNESDLYTEPDSVCFLK